MKEREYLNLPDWQKVLLKISDKNFASYPIIEEIHKIQLFNRLIKIAAHYSRFSISDLLEEDSNLIDFIPSFWEHWITPKLLIGMPIEFFTLTYGKCYFCSHWCGDRTLTYRSFYKSNIKPIYGKCTCSKYIQEKTDVFIGASDCSPYWEPCDFVKTSIEKNIYGFLEKNNNHYSLFDFKKDQMLVSLWPFIMGTYFYSEEKIKQVIN